MDETNHVQIVKEFYKAYANADREFVENIITDDFTFSAPPDPLLTRKTYFERCWPGAGKKQLFDFIRLIEHDSDVIVTYELSAPGADKGRNTEIFTFKRDKVARVEVYFGWTVS